MSMKREGLQVPGGGIVRINPSEAGSEEGTEEKEPPRTDSPPCRLCSWMKAEGHPHLDAHQVGVDLPIGSAAEIFKIHPDSVAYFELCPLCVNLLVTWLQAKAQEVNRASRVTTIQGGNGIWTPDQKR